MKKFVFDTNTLLENPDLLDEYDLEKEKIIIPMIVLEEIDRIKSSMDMVGFNARELIRKLEQYGTKISYPQIELIKKYTKTNDNIILETAAREGAQLVTNDKILKIKSLSVGVKVVEPKLTSNKRSKMYSGFSEIDTTKDVIDEIYQNNKISIDFFDDKIYENEFILLKGPNKQSAICKARKGDLRLISNAAEDYKAFGITPRNLEQLISMEALLDPEISVVSLVGLAGSGKTLLALAAGLRQIHDMSGRGKLYKRIIVTRPIQTVGKDIGYLPGTMEEKMEKWIGPIYDNLETLTGDDHQKIERWFEKGKVEVEAMTYIRGRSLPDSFIIVDECQNITPHEIKTVLTRVGENTKIILTGDIEQIDNPSLNKFSNGLTYMIERFKGQSVSAHVSLTKGERSEVASLAAKIL